LDTAVADHDARIGEDDEKKKKRISEGVSS
jgi:hypothetical protein